MSAFWIVLLVVFAAIVFAIAVYNGLVQLRVRADRRARATAPVRCRRRWQTRSPQTQRAARSRTRSFGLLWLGKSTTASCEWRVASAECAAAQRSAPGTRHP